MFLPDINVVFLQIHEDSGFAFIVMPVQVSVMLISLWQREVMLGIDRNLTKYSIVQQFSLFTIIYFVSAYTDKSQTNGSDCEFGAKD